MNEKIIYINPSEEITSVIDKLVRTKTDEVFLVVPKAAVVGQSLVNLRLLKREADNLKKRIIIVSPEVALQRMANKTGFSVSDSLPSQKDEEKESKEDAILQDQVTPDEFKKFLTEEKKSSSMRMSDIVKAGSTPASQLLVKKIKDISAKSADVVLEQRAEAESKILDEEVPDTEEEKIPVTESFEVKSYQDEGLRKPHVLARDADEYSGKKIKTVSAFPVKIFSIFILSAVVIAGIVFYLALGKADVILTAKKEQTPFDFKVLADNNLSQIDEVANKIPAQLIRLEDKDSEEFAATGQRQMNEKASGIITVYNAYSSSPQGLVETTRFLSQDGKIFRLTESVTVPGAKIEEGKIVASYIDVKVQADQPGDSYNIGPSNFSIPGFQGSPKYTGFYGKSKNNMSGGSTENVRVMTQDDFNKAKEKVWESLRQKIQTELATQISANLTILDGSVEIQMDKVESSAEIGGKAENFTLTVTGSARALVFSEDDIVVLLRNNLSDKLSENKEIADQTPLNYGETKIDIEKGQISFRVSGLQEVFWKIDQEEIKKLIAGKKQNEVEELLFGRPEIKEAQFSLWPFWVRSIPRQTDKIKITVDPVTSSATE
ncbi:MAG: hypothetical protein A2Y98_00070 [Candidatus Portnoybacteria bacterium RBG_19FT_COMBO_36_7]|uniref:Baseplate protein J-like domain-containing protein n=1 Tax=Candidatus Portnoybacteria bacterium RBG_19FT_COMBO_36_7 TaxID=1801992 RepID=A0A1G2F990_9BACT|nr:MAG: hypothetical protein A2Y98_00070 [Candidatus Portnoybacteria bacterium RBG_19FT_COMBO_36_7]